MGRRVLLAKFKHETNTFSECPADIAAFDARAVYRGDDIAEHTRGTNTAMGAFLDAGEKYGWALTHPVSADATPCGRVTRDAYETFTGEILKAAEETPPFDAVLLSLHGAMVAEHTEDGEGTLLLRLRERLGPTVPIGVTLDLHANVTDLMARHANILVSYRKYPHTDMYKTGARAAELIQRALEGEINPRTVVARGDMLDGVDHGRTGTPGPMAEISADADRLMAGTPGVLAVSINAGFPWADILEAGPSAVVVGDGDSPEYRKIADSLVRQIWEKRHARTIRLITAGEAAAAANAPDASGRPLVIADFADNPGGGGYGDSTGLLGELIKARTQNAAFATMYDPEAAAACSKAGAGARVSLKLGGKIDPSYGAPLDVTGTVVSLSDGVFRCEGPMLKGVTVRIGPVAVLRAGGIEIVVASARQQAFDLQFFRSVGIEPVRKATLAVKSAHHFRAAFGPLARDVLVVDEGGGLTLCDFERLHHQHVRRPVFPLDLE